MYGVIILSLLLPFEEVFAQRHLARVSQKKTSKKISAKIPGKTNFHKVK